MCVCVYTLCVYEQYDTKTHDGVYELWIMINIKPGLSAIYKKNKKYPIGFKQNLLYCRIVVCLFGFFFTCIRFFVF